MQTKLPLSTEAGMIERAKRYGLTHGKSVSQIVEDYFPSLTAEEAGRRTALPPITRELAGSRNAKDYRTGDIAVMNAAEFVHSLLP
jgi:hypothetical protein